MDVAFKEREKVRLHYVKTDFFCLPFFIMIKVNNAKDAVKAARDYFTHPEQEECIIICLNNRNEVKDIHFMALGSDTKVIMPKKNICKQAILDLASSVILMHSHPSGDPTPSVSDIRETEEMQKAMRTLDMCLMDHIILGKDSFYSFNDDTTTSYNA